MIQKWSQRFEIKPGRWAYVPTEESVEIGKQVKKHIFSNWTSPPYFYHLCAGGHVSGLRVHQENELFCKLDLADFFGSINLTRVTRVLKSQLCYEDARHWAKWSTVKDPGNKQSHLPFGFVQSPAIASLVLYSSHLGTLLSELANSSDITVSVYVDDILISGNNSTKLTEVYNALLDASVQSNFKVNHSKIHSPKAELSAFNLQLKNGELKVLENQFEEFCKALSTTDNLCIQRGILSYVSKVSQSQRKILESLIK